MADPADHGCRCLHCRRRRSYCSKEKPTCSRCRDAGLECVYEGARKVLVNETYLRELEAKSKALDKVLAGGAPKDGEQDAEAGQAKQHHHAVDEHVSDSIRVLDRLFVARPIPHSVRIKEDQIGIATRREPSPPGQSKATAGLRSHLPDGSRKIEY